MATSKAHKTQRPAADDTLSIEAALKTGTKAVEEGFEKASLNYDRMVSFNKQTAEAVLKAASVAGKGAETINTEVFAYSRQSVEDGVTATKAMIASKTAQEFLQAQSDFTKSAFEAYVAETAKVRDMALDTAKAAIAPLQARFTALADLLHVPRVG